MKPESRPSSEQGLANAVNLAGAFDHEFTQTPLASTPPQENELDLRDLDSLRAPILEREPIIGERGSCLVL